jgi:hypothetical protein
VPTILASLVLFVSLVVFVIRHARSWRLSAQVLVWAPAVALSVLVITDYSAPHYYLALLAPVALACGALADRPARAARIAAAAYAVLAAIGLGHLLAGVQYQREEFSDPWRVVARHAQVAAGGDGLVVASHMSPVFYLRHDPRHAALVDSPPALPGALAAAGLPSRIVVVSTPLSGALPMMNGLAAWMADSLRARGYTQSAATGLVRTDSPALRRRFSSRPFPEFRVSESVWQKR